MSDKSAPIKSATDARQGETTVVVLGACDFAGSCNHRDGDRVLGFLKRKSMAEQHNRGCETGLIEDRCGLPAPQDADVDARQGTGRGEPGSVREGLFNERRPFRPAPCPCDEAPALIP